MRVVDLLRAVRDGAPVAPQDISEFVRGVSDGSIPDYQASAFLMATCLKGLSSEATTALTLAMRDSGEVIDFSGVPGVKVDKHSTGGVGDKISLALAPLVASCGVPVPMISGRGLGHTGGTLDKLESIPGFNVHLSAEQFVRQVGELGTCLIGQTKEVAPADRKLYALRDVTATVESLSLITASILSKKLAEGIDALVLDVKVGRGAFMKTLEDAQALASELKRVGENAGLKMRALLTNMEAPLGQTIGNALEVQEAIDILKGQGPDVTTELTLALGAEMLVLGGAADDVPAARTVLTQSIESGAALAKFAAVIEAQGGDARVLDDASLLPSASSQTVVKAEQAGFVSQIDSFALGNVAMQMGAGRAKAEDRVNPAVGIVMHESVGSKVDVGQRLVTLDHDGSVDELVSDVRDAFVLSGEAPSEKSLIYETL